MSRYATHLGAWTITVGIALSAIEADAPIAGEDCPAPNERLPTYTPTLPASYMKFSRSEIITYIRDNIDEDLAGEIDAATDPQNGCARVCEVDSRQTVGEADATTIAIGTRALGHLWLCAVTMIHEYRHWQNANAEAQISGDPEESDPETEATPCGTCTHVMMGVDDLATVANLCATLAPADRDVLCGMMPLWRANMSRLLTDCYYAGCTACCGFSYIPNTSELWSTPSCCDQ